MTLLFHHLAGDLAWRIVLRLPASAGRAKALIFVREVGAINNAAYRDINGAETLESTYRLRRLRDLGLLEQRGQSRATYYVPTSRFVDLSQGVMADQSSDPAGKSSELPPISSEQLTRSSELAALPADLVAEIEAIGGKAPEERIRGLLLRVCAVRPLTAESLVLFGRRQSIFAIIPGASLTRADGVPSRQPTHPCGHRTVPQPGRASDDQKPPDRIEKVDIDALIANQVREGKFISRAFPVAPTLRGRIPCRCVILRQRGRRRHPLRRRRGRDNGGKTTACRRAPGLLGVNADQITGCWRALSVTASRRGSLG